MEWDTTQLRTVSNFREHTGMMHLILLDGKFSVQKRLMLNSSFKCCFVECIITTELSRNRWQTTNWWSPCIFLITGKLAAMLRPICSKQPFAGHLHLETTYDPFGFVQNHQGFIGYSNAPEKKTTHCLSLFLAFFLGICIYGNEWYKVVPPVINWFINHSKYRYIYHKPQLLQL